jgi:glutathione S-transferase
VSWAGLTTFRAKLPAAAAFARQARGDGPFRTGGCAVSMVTLFHHPFCPHSRFVRLALGEYGSVFELAEERVWERRREFLLLNPAGSTPVLQDEAGPPVPGAAVIMEYLEETRGPMLSERRLIPEDVAGRVEVRRLCAWFNEKFFAEVSEPLVMERIYRRRMPRDAGGGSPDTAAMRVARSNIRYHLAYIGWLASGRDWLAGDRMSYADLAAAAHLSVVDYLGDVPWTENEAAKHWYARVKSRPSFRPLLADAEPGVPASETYADLDF